MIERRLSGDMGAIVYQDHLRGVLIAHADNLLHHAAKTAIPERREQFSRDHDLVEDEAFDPRSVLVVTPSVSYDSRDNFMNPKEGAFLLAGVDLSAGIENSLDDFYTYRTDMRGYITPLSRLTFAGRGSIGKIESYSANSNIPDDALFYLGGTSSVRGFDENLLLINPDGTQT